MCVCRWPLDGPSSHRSIAAKVRGLGLTQSGCACVPAEHYGLHMCRGHDPKALGDMHLLSNFASQL